MAGTVNLYVMAWIEDSFAMAGTVNSFPMVWIDNSLAMAGTVNSFAMAWIYVLFAMAGTVNAFMVAWIDKGTVDSFVMEAFAMKSSCDSFKGSRDDGSLAWVCWLAAMISMVDIYP